MDLQDAILNLAYEAQHFGFHPRNFIDSVYNAFFETMLTSLNQLKQFLILEHKNVLPSVINLSTESMFQELVKLCDKSIDKLEVYLNSNLFCIDPHAVLPEDKIHVEQPCSKEDDENIDKTIEDLKKRILEENAKKHFLKKTIKEQKQVKERLLGLQNELNYLLKTAVECGINKESIESLYSQLNNFCYNL